MKSKILHKLIQEGLRANEIIINAKDISHRSLRRYVNEGWLEQSAHNFILTQKGFDDNQDDNQLGEEINEEHI